MKKKPLVPRVCSKCGDTKMIEARVLARMAKPVICKACRVKAHTMTVNPFWRTSGKAIDREYERAG